MNKTLPPLQPGTPEQNALWDHIYEHGHTSEGVQRLLEKVCQAYAIAAIEARSVPDTSGVFPQWEPGASNFKRWCAKFFGPDSDETYLAEAVLQLPIRKQLPLKAADEFELRRLLAEERDTVRQLNRALADATEPHTFMGEPVIASAPPAQQAEQVANFWDDAYDDAKAAGVQQEPVAWANESELKSAEVSRQRGGPFDSFAACSEGPTAFHTVPLYTHPAPQAKQLARAIESAACADRDAQISDLQESLQVSGVLLAQRDERIAELERELAEARRGANTADEPRCVAASGSI